MNNMPPSDVRTRFAIPRNSSILSLGAAGGFSGAQIWQVETIEETYCLRRWPKEHPTVEHLCWIHQVLTHCATNGAPQVELPLKSTEGDTWVKHDGHLWQLSQWIEGSSNFSDDPNDERLSNAIQCLAKFHLGAAQVNLDFRTSDNVQKRIELLANAAKTIEQVNASAVTSSNVLHDFRTLVSENAASHCACLLAQLKPLGDSVLPIQPVIRDIWHDHLFFVGNEVSGIVDFGAMEMDTVCLDLSRMLGSLIGDNDERWKQAIAEYSAIRALTDPERNLIQLLDQSGVWLGCLNWLKWIFVEGRVFEDSAAVEKRISSLTKRIANYV